jgi:thioredoxin-disulfide reductase
MTYDLIIIGAGPAGATAGIYASRQKLKTLIITKEIGGQIGRKAVDIENYPGFDKISGPDLIRLFQEQLEKNQVEIILDEVLNIKKQENIFELSTSQGQKFESKAVIITTGADPRPLEVPGEKEFIGKGVSYCALCDGPIFRNKTVAVVGGGNAGFESAMFLSNYVSKIYILEFAPQVKADQRNQDLILKSGKAEVITNAKVLEIKGDKFVNSLTYQDLSNASSSRGGSDNDRRSNLNDEKTLEVQGVFVEVGYSPATAFVKDLVDFSEHDEIIAEPETFATKTPGLFAAGDCNKGKYKQIVMAAGEGAKAALAAYEYIQKLN